MKSITLALVILCILTFLNSCSSSRIVNRGYFGEGGSAQDTLYMRATIDSPVTFIFQRNYREGGSSQETLYLKPKEYARFYKLGNDRRKK